MGQTDVYGVPERIVTLGTQWLDAVQAFGITPVGYIDDVAVVSGSPAPWEPDSLSTSVRIDPAADLTAQITPLDPDLILIPGYAGDPGNYATLAKIAPTVPNLGTGRIDSWATQLDILGKILDRQSDAAAATASLTEHVDFLATTYPALRGKTYLPVRLDSPTEFTVFADPSTGANALFSSLNMTLPERVRTEVGGGSRTFPIERIVDFPADLLIVTSQPDLADTFASFTDYPAIQKGTVAYLDIATGTGLDLLSPLSLPYVLTRLEPTLAAVT